MEIYRKELKRLKVEKQFHIKFMRNNKVKYNNKIYGNPFEAYQSLMNENKNPKCICNLFLLGDRPPPITRKNLVWNRKRINSYENYFV